MIDCWGDGQFIVEFNHGQKREVGALSQTSIATKHAPLFLSRKEVFYG